MAVVLGGGGGAFGQIGSFNPAMLVHGEQEITLHREIPVQGAIETVSELTGNYDKGKRAVVVREATSTLVSDGEPLSSTTISAFTRGDGGGGGDPAPELASERPARHPPAPAHQ